MELRKTLLIIAAFLGGVLLGAVFITRFQPPREAGGEDLLAEIGSEQLKRTELEKRLETELIPLRNDEYRIFERGVEEWINQRLLEKESLAQGLSVAELYRKEIWSRVRVSYNDILTSYNKNRELYNLPFDQASSFIHQELRRHEYLRVKEEYLKGLRQKYGAHIYLKKPKSFVEGLALPHLSSHLPEVSPPSRLPASPPAPPPPFSNVGASDVKRSLSKSVPLDSPSQGPQEAPITLVEFADFHCHFCRKSAPTITQLMKNYSGKIRFIFRHYPLSDTPGTGSFLTHEAAACAHEQRRFWEFHDKIFSLTQIPQAADLENIAHAIGVNMTQFRECLESGRHRQIIQREAEEGRQKGVRGTPTFFINGQIIPGSYPYEHFSNLIESILNPDKRPSVPSFPSPSSAPSVPAAQPVQFDDLEGRPSLGPKEAPITLVEFSDFHCPFCKRVASTLEQLMKNYPGQIRRVWRHYPLAMHAGADRTHEASECAHEQGKFWAYHEKVFGVQEGSFDDATLLRLADEAGLNKKKFEKCLTSGKYEGFIKKEVEKGSQVGVRGTPTIFVNGRILSGAQPYENFDRIIKNELAKKSN